MSIYAKFDNDKSALVLVKVPDAPKPVKPDFEKGDWGAQLSPPPFALNKPVTVIFTPRGNGKSVFQRIWEKEKNSDKGPWIIGVDCASDTSVTPAPVPLAQPERPNAAAVSGASEQPPANTRQADVEQPAAAPQWQPQPGEQVMCCDEQGKWHMLTFKAWWRDGVVQTTSTPTHSDLWIKWRAPTEAEKDCRPLKAEHSPEWRDGKPDRDGVYRARYGFEYFLTFKNGLWLHGCGKMLDFVLRDYTNPERDTISDQEKVTSYRELNAAEQAEYDRLKG